MKTNISVIGLGNWGTALAEHLSLNGHDVLAWSVFDEEVRTINQTGHHVKLYPKLKLHFKATSVLEEALNRKVVVVALPSLVLHHYCSQFVLPKDSILVSVIKGFDKDTLLTPLQLIEAKTKNPPHLCVVSGPSFAKDVLGRRPVGLVSGSKSQEVAEFIADVFTSELMRVYVSTDPLGVELGGAVKNVIALAAGVTDGLDLGESARAGVITRGLAEMMRLSQKMGAKPETLSGLSGLGDLIMTASSLASRNYTVGFRLGKGEKLETILATLGSVAEGVRSTPIVLQLAKKYEVEVPISDAMGQLLSGQQSPEALLKILLSRPRKSEA